MPIGAQLHATAVGTLFGVKHAGDVSVGEADSESYIQFWGSGDLHCVDTGYSMI